MPEDPSSVSYVTELKSLPDQIAAAIRESIISGALVVDERLPNEAELAAQFGVSRPTIREALKRLAAKNLIRSRRGASGGNFVSLPSRDQVRSDLSTTATLLVSHQVFSLAEVAESRRLLETMCARLAAERRTKVHLAALVDALEQQARPDLSDEEFCAADVAFHRVIVEAAGNPVLDYVMVFALEALHPSTNLVINRFRKRADVLTLQQHLLDAIKSSDPDAAELAINAQMEHLTGIYEVAQEWVEARRSEREDEDGIDRTEE
ncbi:MAG: DNA-binding FadR family transcriptional regulator [Ilumatobacter sp.]|jgi:DNA-binding FadR family transcriptional regulator